MTFPVNFIDFDLGVFSVGLVVRIYSGSQNSSFRFIKAFAFTSLHRIFPPDEFRNFVASLYRKIRSLERR